MLPKYLSIKQLVQFGSNLSVRQAMQAGGRVSVLGYTSLGSCLSLRYSMRISSGLSVIEAAVGSTFERVADSGFTMVRERDGAELFCENIEERDEDWLEEMLVSAEITSVAPAKPLG